MNSIKGSLWRVWDLHVHTPASIFHKYGPRNDETWEKYIRELEALPSAISVLGINDYMFLDGYKRILEEKKKGRLTNIDLLLPVIELRLDKFGGTDSNLARINYHVIFSEDINIETIQEQFLNALSCHYVLSPENQGKAIKWGGVPTKKGLEDLGNKIIESVPQNQRAHFGTPLVEGFNGLSVSLENIQKILDGPYFKGKYFTAVGKTEWWNIKWNDKSIAEKKNIINSADLVFTATDSIKNYERARESLRDAGVNDRLLDCSDAHSYSSSTEKDRLGNCFTWIKADPTFQGLKQVIIETDERLYVGETPPQLSIVDKNKTKYVKTIVIRKSSSKDKVTNETWFNTDILVNHGLVAIIGNKGSGKSALGDILGLLGNSSHQNAFSFLNPTKFKKPPENKAKSFEATLEWESGESISRNLDYTIDSSEVERIKYVPQNYFEDICNQLGNIEETAFDKELKKVIFSHVSESDRLGKTNLDELMQYKSSELRETLDSARQKVAKTNKQIVELENRLTSEYRDSLANQLEAKCNELKAERASKPKPVKKPSKKGTQQSNALKKQEALLENMQKEILEKKGRLKLVAEQLSKVVKIEEKIENLTSKIDEFREEIEELSEGLELHISENIALNIDLKSLHHLKEKLTEEKNQLENTLDKKNKSGLPASIENLKSKIEAQRDQLDKPNKDYEMYRDELTKWESSIRKIEGSEKEPGTIAYLEKAIKELDNIPDQIKALEEKRLSQSRRVYKLLEKQKKMLQELYAPVQTFISEHPEIGKKIELNFGASIMNFGFSETLLEWVNLTKAKFSSTCEGKKLLDDMVNNHDFDDEESTIAFAEEVNKLLHSRQDKESNHNLSEILKTKKTVESLYDFIYSFEYLDARYVLRLGGKELRQLSPGERGALLIVFYLLVDLDTIPLVIDQPEHNLDNETLTKLLVPAIKKAKKRRQIIIVTHNPILAVVCNADQVIAASLDIKDNYKLEYISGSIENPRINKRIVDVLEGTMSSFDNREKKYIREYLEAFQSN